jgi:L-lactate dehydrogenase complex protein LldG
MNVNARDKILNSIRKSLDENKVSMPFPEVDKETDFFTKSDTSLEEHFAQEFIKLGGKFVYCANHAELFSQLTTLADAMNWHEIQTKDKYLLSLMAEYNFAMVKQAKDMYDIEVGLSLCEALVARTGSTILSSGQDSGRALPVYSPIHITIAYTHQLVWDIKDAIDKLKEKYNQKLPSLVSLTTGPSRTADIEKTLVVGVHGPKEVYVFLIER